MGRKGSKGRTAERAGGVDVLQCARCYALLKELTLHLIPRARSGVFEMLPRRLASTRSQFELAERRKIERITHESIGIGNGANLLQATLRPLELRDGNGAVEGDDRRRTDGDQCVVQDDDLRPV